MKCFHVPLLSASLLLLSSCGQNVIIGHGPRKTETRQLSSSSFSKVEISAPVDAHITVGGMPSLSFDGFANVIPHLRTEVKGNTLRIYLDDITDISTDKNIIANISLPAITGLDLTGSSDAVLTGPINESDFKLDVSGAGSVDINELHVQSFDADLSGSTHLLLRAGEVGKGSFHVSGSGEIKAYGVSQQSTALDLSGSAEAEVNVVTRLKVDISGSGTVRYKGHPSVSQDISGSGVVKDAN